MHLTITTPEKKLRYAPISKVTLPTQIGEITVLPGHQPLVSVLDAGVIRLVPEQLPTPDQEYVMHDDHVVIAVSRGMVAVIGDEVIVTTSIGTTSTDETLDVLEQMQQEMHEKIEKIKTDGNEQDLEQALEHMEKITADLRIAKISNMHR